MPTTKEILTSLAKQILRKRGLEPDFSEKVTQELSEITTPAAPPENITDLRTLLWCSIDNDDSRDLDQLTYAEKNNDDTYQLWIAVADVDAIVHKDSGIDYHAQINTTSIYTPAKIFPMLPEKLSTNLTSLNEGQDRIAMVVKILIDKNGEFLDSSITQAVVHNYAQLAYNATGDWLDGKHSIPNKINNTAGLEKTLRVQSEATQILRRKRSAMGSLTLESAQVIAKVSDSDEIVLDVSPHNSAHQLIEEFMIAANNVMAKLFQKQKIASLRRVVRKPNKWDRIVEVANNLGESLPREPNSKALDEFLVKRKEADPVSFPDLSLTIIKLMGRGEYVVENVGDTPVGHFGLAITNYTHSTAPNRRYPDIITQRQCKAFLQGKPSHYPLEELYKLADHCTQQEDASSKAERQLNKSAAAILLTPLIGTQFHGIITGVDQMSTWIRIFNPPVEGKVIKGYEKLDVGDRVTVTLVSVDVPNGYIDFEARTNKN